MPIDPDLRKKLPDCLPPSLLDEATVLLLKRNQRLFRLGEPVTRVYFVGEGELKAVRYQPDGKESIMLRSAVGDFFGESAMIVERYVCDAFSTRESTVVAFPARRFREQLQTDASFAFAFANLMAAAARRQCSRYERLRLSRARDRVLHLLSCETDAQGLYELTGPLVELADELGLEPETLYRTLGELEREGAIARTRRSLQRLSST